MFRKALSAIIASALVLAVPVATAAEPAPKGILGAFELQGTNGYRLFGLVDSTGKSGLLQLFVRRRGEEATYLARGSVTKESAEFDLGRLGRVDVALQPRGQTEIVHPLCGKPVSVEGEEFVGSIEFHGEEEFTEAAATSTPVRFKPLLSLICGVVGSEGESGGRLPGAELQVRRPGGPKLQLDQNRPGARVFYEASMSEREGGLRVNRSVRGHLSGGHMSFVSSLAAAKFDGASPFSGSATYGGKSEAHESRPARGTWLGNLQVDFPGRAAVPLAGPSFSATIVAHLHRGFHG